MRIIAGEHRGRKLLPPESDVTRPITDRAKQSLFDVLSPYINGSVVYDCFAGTGSMGLECLSRGAKTITFFEADRSAIVRLRKNVATMDADERCRIVAGDLFHWFEQNSVQSEVERADLIFLDPPYRFLRERKNDLFNLAARIVGHHLALEGIVIFRHDSKDALEFAGLPRFDCREYGEMMIELLHPA
jgi:16S rRNA (guanine(966)-N(2))-methyltransferase RsmD